VLALGLLGGFYAATDGVLPALLSQIVPPSVRTSGLALAQTTLALGQVGGSVAFGALWVAYGVTSAFALAALALGAGLLAATWILWRGRVGRP
jgi:predicted MFS family arabinose efflux permease